MHHALVVSLIGFFGSWAVQHGTVHLNAPRDIAYLWRSG